MYPCVIPTPQELFVTGELPGPNQPKGNPAPSMGIVNPLVGLGILSLELLFH